MAGFFKHHFSFFANVCIVLIGSVHCVQMRAEQSVPEVSTSSMSPMRAMASTNQSVLDMLTELLMQAHIETIFPMVVYDRGVPAVNGSSQLVPFSNKAPGQYPVEVHHSLTFRELCELCAPTPETPIASASNAVIAERHKIDEQKVVARVSEMGITVTCQQLCSAINQLCVSQRNGQSHRNGLLAGISKPGRGKGKITILK
jgi:hypothetical protein